MFQTKEQHKTSGKDLNGTEICDSPDKEFKITVKKNLKVHQAQENNGWRK